MDSFGKKFHELVMVNLNGKELILDKGGWMVHKKEKGVWCNESIENIDLMEVVSSHTSKSFVMKNKLERKMHK